MPTAGVAGGPAQLSATPASYVALGDSYASGEGVEPFLPGSDQTRPENRCHRSALAYSRLLARQPGMPARSEFWACSGARIADLLPGRGQWREPGQLEHLDADTELVTLSVGGNDLQFAAAIGTCLVMRGCAGALGVVAGMLLWRTAERLDPLYREVLTRAPRAQVYVVGYPRFLADRPGALCVLAGLDPGEARWLNSQVSAADAAFRRAVDGIADARLHYVSTLDALAGGEACGATGAFVHAVVPRHPSYSFHPTAAGQARLAERVGQVLAQPS